MSRLRVEHKNPAGLFASRAFSQAVTVSGNAKTIYIGGQNAIDSEGRLVGQGDLELQTKQVLKNIETILASENAGFADLIKLNIHLLNGCDPQIGYKAFQESVGVLEKPPLVTVLFVAAFANPSYLVEIDGIAVVEDEE